MQLEGPCSSFVSSTIWPSLFLQLSRRLSPSPVRPVSQIGLHPSLLFPFVFSLLVSVLQHHPCCIRKRHAAQPGAAASPTPSVFQSSAGRIARLVKSDASHHTQVHNSDLPVPSNSYHAMWHLVASALSTSLAKPHLSCTLRIRFVSMLLARMKPHQPRPGMFQIAGPKLRRVYHVQRS